MQLSEITDDELVSRYQALRKSTKHDKRGRGMALSEKLDQAKKTCLFLKDEITRRGIDISHEDCDLDLQSVDGAALTVIEGGFRPAEEVERVVPVAVAANG